MTADAKVGLLLGLFFIVIIAFLVNGLPNFIKTEHPTTAEATILTPKRPDLVLDREVFVPRLDPGNNIPTPPTPEPTETLVLDTSDPADRVMMPDLPKQPQAVDMPNTPIVIDTSDLTQSGQDTPATVSKTTTYTVAKGENLAVIAQKFYGKEEGNRRIVIQKLYEANKNVLKSPDTIRVGDTLTIPPLDELQNKKKTKTVAKAPSPSEKLLKAASDMFEKVTKKETASVSEYVVQEGDNLWSIAERQLGDGKRFPELKKINKIKDANTLVVGARIKIPAQ